MHSTFTLNRARALLPCCIYLIVGEHRSNITPLEVRRHLPERWAIKLTAEITVYPHPWAIILTE